MRPNRTVTSRIWGRTPPPVGMDEAGERSRASLETRLRASQAYNRGIIEAAPVPLAVVGMDLVITDVNESMVRSAGYPRSELIAQPFARFFDISSASAAAFDQVFVRGSGSGIALGLRTKAGDSREARCDAATFRDPDGRLLAILAADFH